MRQQTLDSLRDSDAKEQTLRSAWTFRRCATTASRFRSPKSDVLLMPDAVDPIYIKTIQALPHGVTLFRRPTELQYREHPATIRCVVPACEREWRAGTQFSLVCGEPITWRAIADIAQ